MHSGIHYRLFVLFIFSICSSIGKGRAQVADSLPAPIPITKRFVVSPIVYYQPETSWAFGAGGIYYFKPANHYIPDSRGYEKDSLILKETNASQIKAIAVYTLEKQFQAETGGDIYTRDNAWFISYNIGYYRYPGSFFGIGNNTLEEDEERYTNEHPYIRLNVQKKLRTNLYAGVKTFFEHTSITNIDSGGIFDTQVIPGEEGGFNTGIGPWLTIDTRNNINYPTKGFVLDASSVFHEKFTGSDYVYVDNTLELSYFINTWKRQVLGFNFFGNFNPGDPPFNQMAELGGTDHMRGNYEGRYRDKYYLTLQTEYRLPVWKIFAADFFYGIGEVAHTAGDFNFDALKYSYGAGLRINLLPGDTYNFRLDYGFGSDGDRGFYVQFGEAF